MADIAVETQKSRWLKFFSHPTVGITASLASIIGVPLAFYFYFLSVRERDLTYFVNPVWTPIVQAGVSSDIAVTFKGQSITGNVTAVQIGIWNAGKEPILADHILKPVRLRTADGKPILEANIRKVSREVIHVTIDSKRFDKGELGVDWRILEQNDGAVIQIVYAGPVKAKLNMDGVIVGEGSIHEPHNRNSKILSMSLLILAAGGLLWCNVILDRSRENKRSWRRLFIVLLALIACIVIAGFAGENLNKPPAPPFGF